MQVYIKAWKHCRQLSHLQLETLLVSMAKLSSSFIFDVPPLVSHCKTAAECFINFEMKNKTEIAFKEAVLPKVEIIVNFVKVCTTVRCFLDFSSRWIRRWTEIQYCLGPDSCWWFLGEGGGDVIFTFALHKKVFHLVESELGFPTNSLILNTGIFSRKHYLLSHHQSISIK